MLRAAAAFVSDFADQAVVLPSAALIAMLLALAGWRRGAIVWSVAIVGTFGLMLVLKLGFGACGHLVGNGDIESPSGHTAAAGVFYGSIFAYFGERVFGRGLLAATLILLVVALVGTSRILLGAHTVPEVALGAAIGLVAALLTVRTAGPPPKQQGRMSLILLPALLLLFLSHGMHLPAEAAIRSFADSSWLHDACR